MKSQILKSARLLFLISFILGACSKKDILQNPQTTAPNNNPGGGSNPAEKGIFRFVVDVNLAGQPYHPSNLHAVVTITNDKNEEVVKEKKLTLNLNGTVKTEDIELPVGNYKLTSFRMEYGNVYTHFVIPMAGSSKASLVQQPLAMDFSVAKSATGEVPVKVIKVLNGEKPALFGYPVGAFDYSQEENSPFVKIKIKAIMQIGNVLYDSIPAALMLTTWDKNGEQTTSYLALKAGANEISLLKAATKFRFRVDKWGTWDEMTLDKANIDEGTMYVLGGNKAARKLKSEITYKLVEGNYVAESKTEYIYDAAGKVSQVKHFKKRKDNTPYLDMTEQMEYNGDRVSKISRYDENNTRISFISFTYDQQGKVRNMSQSESGQETNATVEYLFNPIQEIGIHYQYPGKAHEMRYSKRFYNGNMMEDASYTTYQASETGKYDYDFNINPYIHLNLPDLFLSNSSKNNMTYQYKTYQGGYPTIVPYNYSYTYDNDGYPKELIKHFKTYATNKHLSTSKTVYTY